MSSNKLENFNDWVASKIKCPKVEVKCCEYGYGLFVRESESSQLGETLIQVPKDFIICPEFIRSLPEYNSILSRVNFEPCEILALFIGVERFFFLHCNGTTPAEIGPIDGGINIDDLTKDLFLTCFPSGTWQLEQRWWKCYFDVLPQSFNTPLFRLYRKNCSDLSGNKFKAAIENFCNHHLPLNGRKTLLKQSEDLDTFAKKIQTVFNFTPSSDLNIEHLGRSAGFEHLKTIIWKNVWIWAWHIVQSRCIFVDNFPGNSISSTNGSIVIVPFIDLINHSASNEQCIAVYHKHSSCLCVIAEKAPIPSGRQLYFCYGCHDNLKLWLEYGFMMDGNIFNKVDISADLFIALAKARNLVPYLGQFSDFTKSENLMDRYEGIIRSANFNCTIYATDDKPGYGLRKNCAILLLKQEQLNSWRDIIFNESAIEDEALFVILRKILQVLYANLKRRKKKCELREVRCFWLDQIEITQRILANCNETISSF